MRRYWTKQSHNLSSMSETRLAQTNTRANQTLRYVKKVATTSSEKIRGRSGAGWPIDLPSRTTWSMRPKVWSEVMDPQSHAPVKTGCKLAEGVTVYHDCSNPQISLRQHRPNESNVPAPFALLFDVLDFEGSYLSFVIEMPETIVPEVTKNDLIRLQCKIEMEAEEDIFIRLNVRNGPNVEQISRHLDLSLDMPWVEFDMFYTSIDFHLISDIWIDVIVERPAMNSIRIDDLTLIRRPRASV